MHFPFEIFSPEEQIQNPRFLKNGISLFMKRDDKIHPFISGNKWRKLKHQLEHAKSQNITNLVTFGGAWSNHLLATAAAAAQFGFNAIAYVRGEEIRNPVLDMCRLYGMELRFVDRESYKNKHDLFALNHNSENDYFIDEGGKSELGLLGCSEIINELKNEYDHIFVASGTGTTVAGIQLGIQQKKLKTRVNSIPVLKGADHLLDEFSNWKIDTQKIKLHLDYHCSGYAKTTPELISFIQQFIESTGIMIEPTYTGKLMYAVFDLLEKDYFKPNSNILVIHTGGLTGLLGHLDKFNR
ncbi:1-aminocyclopropane-1-carboxylate deaminase [Sphingobacterium cellulitidis]|uniref:1-aminocyclopropane-1-carboxylate deaminase/D-cysteine desulfhydrase n=1 Tax=Sphingobacterium cellulitidis TaxID=1768011 RepID=UPI000B93A1B7|nr:pyridoxal-phosphate dependent enzyme [Sphingobacterium cellulitidis]OYD44707.1 1-aminocyclopropane-1-carboxylate deaminase [Sphingobacterium cellulitidis]